jgi:hypothetical protein
VDDATPLGEGITAAATGSLGPEIEVRGFRSPGDAFFHVRHAFEHAPHIPQSKRAGPVLLGTADGFRIIGPGAFFGRIEAAPEGCRIVGRWGVTREQRFVFRYLRPLAVGGVLATMLWYYPVRETWFLLTLAGAFLGADLIGRFVVPSTGAQRAEIESILRTSAGAKG